MESQIYYVAYSLLALQVALGVFRLIASAVQMVVLKQEQKTGNIRFYLLARMAQGVAVLALGLFLLYMLRYEIAWIFIGVAGLIMGLQIILERYLDNMLIHHNSKT